MKIYKCTINGANASAHECDDGFFTVLAGSKWGVARPSLDSLALKYREVLVPDGTDWKESFITDKDFTYTTADIAARVFAGCPCDECAWVAENGSHPIVRRQSE